MNVGAGDTCQTIDLIALIRLGLAIRGAPRMNVHYHVELSEAERCELTALVEQRQAITPGKIKRAQILLAADSGLSDEDIAAAVRLSAARPFTGPSAASLKVNLEAALNEEPRAGADRKLTSNEEALLIATACSSPPEVGPAGRWSCWLARWSTGRP